MNDIERHLNDAGFETSRMDTATVRDAPTWECKVGLHDGKTSVLPGGGDAPMRSVVEAEFKRITGQEPDFIFSGWGAKLTKTERHIEYNEDGKFSDAMLGNVLDQIKEWDSKLLEELSERIAILKDTPE